VTGTDWRRRRPNPAYWERGAPATRARRLDPVQPRQSVILVLLGTLLALTTASCSSARAGVSRLTVKHSTTTTAPRTTLSTSPTTPLTSVAGPSGPPPTVIVHYPTPYDPGYITIDQLVQDSTFIVLGTLQPAGAGSDSSGNVVMAYPISWQQVFGTTPPIGLNVSQAEVSAAHLSVGKEYVFFWSADLTNKTACIVGGVRGVFGYDSSTGAVTRLDDSTASEIPTSESLGQFSSAVAAARELLSSEPMRSPSPPVCSPSATGLAS
jgi:hypothetical protein